MVYRGERSQEISELKLNIMNNLPSSWTNCGSINIIVFDNVLPDGELLLCSDQL